MATEKKKKVHYVDNKAFLAAIIERKELIKEAESEGEPKPQISNYLGAVSYTHLTLPTKA